MAANILVDAGFLVALLSRPTPITTGRPLFPNNCRRRGRPCDAALSEAFHLLGEQGSGALAALLRRRAVVPLFRLGDDVEGVLRLMHKYANVPMRLADACLVRMTETLADPVLLTTDTDFRIYRRHGRQAIPCILPG